MYNSAALFRYHHSNGNQVFLQACCSWQWSLKVSTNHHLSYNHKHHEAWRPNCMHLYTKTHRTAHPLSIGLLCLAPLMPTFVSPPSHDAEMFLMATIHYNSFLNAAKGAVTTRRALLSLYHPMAFMLHQHLSPLQRLYICSRPVLCKFYKDSCDFFKWFMTMHWWFIMRDTCVSHNEFLWQSPL